MKPLNELVRENILGLKAYSSARNEFSGIANVYLDANENPYPVKYNRYPDPLQQKLKEKIGSIKKINPEQIFLGNGSDEAIDLLIRIFCEPGIDSILITEPTYGMYSVCAEINNVKVQSVSLNENFELQSQLVLNALSASTKIIFLCSPNNPTGNLLNKEEIISILKTYDGIVVIDEAYIDFAKDEGWLPALHQYPNLVVLQTLSKAWGLAGLRLGIAFASKEIISLLNKIKYPYNVNLLTQQIAIKALENILVKKNWVTKIVQERDRIKNELEKKPSVKKVFPSDANFLLVKTINASNLYQLLLAKGIIVRDRSQVIQCNNCLRITIGTPQENNQLLNTLKSL
jgi:histidinol-phosphate aminotransferase